MKKKTIFLFFFVVIGLSGCLFDIYDNFSISFARRNARELILESEVTGNIRLHEEQWFFFRANETIRIAVEEQTDRSSNSILAYDQYNQIARSSEGRSGYHRMEINVEAGKTYYFKLVGARASSYRIIAFDPRPEEAARRQQEEARRQQEEERRQQEEIRRQQEEAIWQARANNFIYRHNNLTAWNIDYFIRGDLFDAVVASENLGAINQFGTFPSRDFVSEVIFISQDVTSVRVRNFQGDVSRTLRVQERLGLSSGQRIRMYYRVYRVQQWEILGVEML